MKKKVFILLEIVVPLIIFSSWLIWNIFINNNTFSEAFAISTDITFIILILMNALIAFGYKNILEKQ